MGNYQRKRLWIYIAYFLVQKMQKFDLFKLIIKLFKVVLIFVYL